MKNKKLIIICLAVAVMLAISFAVSALGDVHINYEGSLMEGAFTSNYALGAQGTQLIGTDDAYALTALGVERISGNINYDGGGGLLYNNGSVRIKSDTVRVGLRYYYSDSRDSGMESANLENAVGSGYAFGYVDSSGQFVLSQTTNERKITMRPVNGNGVGVFIAGTDTPIYFQEFTDKSNYLTVVPLSNGGDAVTWFAGNRYYGYFEYAVLGGNKLTVVNVVDLENYVMGVCAREMTESWPVEALKAQALAARTYVQSYIGSSTYYFNCGFDVTGDTYCQAYSGCTNVGTNIQTAVMSTKNQYITYNGSLIQAVYFSSDGGATESNENVYGNSAHPYLKGIVDPYEAAADSVNSHSSWRTVYTNSQLASKVGLSDIASYDITRSETGNVIRIIFRSANGRTSEVSRSACRTTLGLNSIRYDITMDNQGRFVFEGSGWGHNLGMSQFGAYAMAKYYGKTYEDILGFYYTRVGISYGIL